MHANVRFEHQLLADRVRAHRQRHARAPGSTSSRRPPPTAVASRARHRPVGLDGRAQARSHPRMRRVPRPPARADRRARPRHLRPGRQPARSPRSRRPNGAPAEDRHDPLGRPDEPVRRVAEGRRGARPLGRRGPAEGPAAHRRPGQRRRHRRRLARGDGASSVPRRRTSARPRSGSARTSTRTCSPRWPTPAAGTRTTPPRRTRLPRSSRASSRG